MARTYFSSAGATGLRNDGTYLYDAPGAVVEGEMIKLNDMPMVALTGIAAAGEVEVAIMGVVSGAKKVTAEAWSKGDRLYFDPGTDAVSDVSTSRRPVAVAWEDAAATETHCVIKLWAYPEETAS